MSWFYDNIINPISSSLMGGISYLFKPNASGTGQTNFSHFTDELFNGGANRLALQEAEKARQMQMYQFNKNMAFQREQFDYQKALNDQQIAREDTAVQRQVADMRAAGLSPLAQVSGSSTGSLSGTGFSGPSMSGASASPSGFSLPSMIGAVSEIANMVIGIQQNKANLDMSKAQLAKTAAETESILGDNKFTSETYNDRVKMQRLLSIRNEAELDNYLRDFNYKNHFGITDSMSDTEKTIRTILGSLNYNLQSGHDLSSYGDKLYLEFTEGSDPRFGEYNNKLDAKNIFNNLLNAFGASEKSKSMFLKTPLGEFLTKLLGVAL